MGKVHWTAGRMPCMIAVVVTAAVACAAAAWPAPASADGALAIGRPADVSNQGFAFGMTANIANPDQASERALDLCRTAKGAQSPARNVCQVVQTLHQQCAAVAMDPEKGTPGVGWAVANDKTTAEHQALAQCYDTAGTGRQSFCVVSASICDAGTSHEPGN